MQKKNSFIVTAMVSFTDCEIQSDYGHVTFLLKKSNLALYDWTIPASLFWKKILKKF